MELRLLLQNYPCQRGLPENTKYYFNTLNIDRVMQETVKTLFENARMERACL